MRETHGLADEDIQGSTQTMREVEKLNQQMSEERSKEVTVKRNKRQVLTF